MDGHRDCAGLCPLSRVYEDYTPKRRRLTDRVPLPPRPPRRLARSDAVFFCMQGSAELPPAADRRPAASPWPDSRPRDDMAVVDPFTSHEI